MKNIEEIKIGKIPLIYFIFPPLGVIYLLKYFIDKSKKES